MKSIKRVLLVGICLILMTGFVGCSKSKEVEYFSKPKNVDTQFYKAMLTYYEHYWDIAYGNTEYNKNDAKIINAELKDYSKKIDDGIYSKEDNELIIYILELQYEFAGVNLLEISGEINIQDKYKTEFEIIKDKMYKELNVY